MLDYAFDPKPYIYDVLSYFTQETGYKVIALEGYDNLGTDKNFKMINKTDSSVNDFISLFANASLVITSSFHGTAFAVNFGKPLISLIPNDKGDDRQSTLLKSLNLEQCIVPIGSNIKNINPYYNVEHAQNLLEKERESSLQWIQTTIKQITISNSK